MLKRAYGGAIRDQLRGFPVWELGTPVAIGDYGTIEDRCFHKLGSLRALDSGAPLEPADVSGATTEWGFASEGATATSLDLDATVAALTIASTRECSVYLRAADSVVEAMPNIAEVGSFLKHSSLWDRRWVFVTSLRRAATFSVVMTTKAHGSVTITAAKALLEALKVGKLSGKAGLTITGDDSLVEVGVTGPIYVGLSRIKTFGGLDLAGGLDKLEAVDPALDLDLGPGE